MEPNLNYIKQLAAGDRSFEEKFIKILKNEFPSEEAEYLQNISKKDLAQAALNVHKLKHKLSILGLVEDYEVAVRHEEALEKGNTEWEDDFSRILTKVDEFIKSIEL